MFLFSFKNNTTNLALQSVTRVSGFSILLTPPHIALVHSPVIQHYYVINEAELNVKQKTLFAIG